jgi:hypothetical protein
MMGVLACFAFAVTLILALGPAFDARERRNRRARDRAANLCTPGRTDLSP